MCIVDQMKSMSKKVAVIRREHFNAAHRLFHKDWTDEKNAATFGKCSFPNFHGHNYELEIKVVGEIDPVTGYVMDLKLLSDLVNEWVLEKLDHKNLNLDVDFMYGKLASCENLIVEIWKILEAHLPAITTHGKLYSLRLYETPRNYVEYFGE